MQQRQPPVLLLGAPRGGLGAIARVLAAGTGIAFGDHRRPGFPAVEHGLATLLREHDRDWTCPPTDVDPEAPASAVLRAGVVELQRRRERWGVADPRTLFSLPVFAASAPSFQLVAVVRDHATTVGSVVRHHGLPADVADPLVRAHWTRLRRVAAALDVPVVDLSAPPQEVLARLGGLAGGLAAGWDHDAAARAFEPHRLTARRIGLDDHNGLIELRTSRVAASRVTSAEELAVAAGSLPGVEELDRHVGPRAAARRGSVREAAHGRAGPVVEVVQRGVVAPAPPGWGSRPATVEAADLASLHAAVLGQPSTPGVILLPDVVAWLHPDELADALRLLHGAVRLDGVVVAGCSAADRDARRRHGWPQLSAADLAAAARAADFAVTQHRVDANLTVLLLLPVPTAASVALAAERDGRPGQLAARAAAWLRGLPVRSALVALGRRARATAGRLRSRVGARDG